MKQLGTYLFFAVVVCAISTSKGIAQCPAFGYARLDANKVSTQINNSAEQYLNYWNSGGYSSEYEVPRGSGKHTIFASSFWMGGYDPLGELHLASSTYRALGSEYYCGPYRNNVAYSCGPNYDTPVGCFVDGALWLSSGKVMNFYLGGFQVYDPQTNLTTQRVLPPYYQNMKAIELPDGKVLLHAWKTNVNDPSEVMVIDTSTFALPIPDTLLFCQRFASMTVMPSGNVFFVGPYGSEEFDPVTHGDITKASSLGLRQRHDAILLNNGLVLVAGGAPTYVELYNPANNTWAAGPNLMAVRNYFPQLTQLPSGDILITGGNTATLGTDVYLTATNTMGVGPTMPLAFRAHQTYLINANEVLIAHEATGLSQSSAFIMNIVTSAAQNIPLMAINLPTAYKAGQMVVANDTVTHFVYYDVVAERLIGNRWQHVWKVTQDQITQFQQDFANSTVNFVNYKDIETWPGNGSPLFGEDAQLAPYIDLDFDGVYDPLHDGDYPCFPGDQGLWWVFNDDGPHNESHGLPLKAQVEALAYAFDCSVTPCPDTTIDYATFYHYEITNKSQDDYHDVYLGNFVDVDLGMPYDDYTASDTALGLSICYNGDAFDEWPGMGYGLIPPATGYLCLPNGQIDHMSGFVECDTCLGATTYPVDAPIRYNFLSGYWSDSTHIVNNGLDGHDSTAPGPITNFMFSGDPGWCGSGTGNGGWTESGAGNQPFDRRSLQNFGPYDLVAGASIELDYVILYSRAATGDNLSSVCKLRMDAAAIRNWWLHTVDRSCFDVNTKVTPKQSAWGPKIVPNPNSGLFSVDMGSAVQEDLQLELVNIQGQVVLLQTLPAGQSAMQVDGSALPKGIYLLRVMGGNVSGVKRVIIQ